jgi:hypothetical protein
MLDSIEERTVYTRPCSKLLLRQASLCALPANSGADAGQNRRCVENCF